MRIWITNSCSKFLDVRETNSRVSHQSRIRNSFLRSQIRMESTPAHCNCAMVFLKHVRIPMLWATPLAHVTSVTPFLIPLITCHTIWPTTFQAVNSYNHKEGLQRRHVSRTHRVDLNWKFQRINLDSTIFIRLVRTTEHLADMLTKCAFTTILLKLMMRFLNMNPPPNLKVDRSRSKSSCSAVSHKHPLAISNA